MPGITYITVTGKEKGLPIIAGQVHGDPSLKNGTVVGDIKVFRRKSEGSMNILITPTGTEYEVGEFAGGTPEKKKEALNTFLREVPLYRQRLSPIPRRQRLTSPEL